jgi:hypothetical protein
MMVLFVNTSLPDITFSFKANESTLLLIFAFYVTWNGSFPEQFGVGESAGLYAGDGWQTYSFDGLRKMENATWILAFMGVSGNESYWLDAIRLYDTAELVFLPTEVVTMTGPFSGITFLDNPYLMAAILTCGSLLLYCLSNFVGKTAELEQSKNEIIYKQLNRSK